MSRASLRERFGALWRRLGAGGRSGPAFDELHAAYQQPQRRYHDLEHLRDCLEQLDSAPAGVSDRDVVEAALWFHDVVYDPRAADNEARSADWAGRVLGEAGVAGPRAREVERLIRLTDHAVPARDPAAALVCDVDLSILGRPAAEFTEYERRIRAEYDRVPEPLYRSRRAALLTRLLTRPSIYVSEHFRRRYEKEARRNLRRSLERMGAGADVTQITSDQTGDA
jgi:predicted metal-dependent HD superfamily phosphohydrolase